LNRCTRGLLAGSLSLLENGIQFILQVRALR
jgi:hypothetical protein